jgi:anti-anti-sigma factor
MVPFRVTTEPRDDALVVHVEGDLDLATVAELEAVLDRVRGEGAARSVVDLTPCTFIDSSGSRSLVRQGEQFADAGRDLWLVCPPENERVRFVLDLVGVTVVMRVEATL